MPCLCTMSVKKESSELKGLVTGAEKFASGVKSFYSVVADRGAAQRVQALRSQCVPGVRRAPKFSLCRKNPAHVWVGRIYFWMFETNILQVSVLRRTHMCSRTQKCKAASSLVLPTRYLPQKSQAHHDPGCPKWILCIWSCSTYSQYITQQIPNLCCTFLPVYWLKPSQHFHSIKD